MRSIRTKITLTFVLLAVVAVSIMVLLIGIFTQSNLTRNRIIDLASRLDTITPLLQPAGEYNDRTLHEHIRRMGLVMNMRITLIDEKGTVLLDSGVLPENLSSVRNHIDRPEVRQALEKPYGSDMRLSSTLNVDYVYVAKVVSLPKHLPVLGRVKFLRLAAPGQEIRDTVRDERRNILMVGGIVIVCVTIASLFLSRRIANPMVEIARAVEKIRAGNLDTRIIVRNDDEVGMVARAVNEMVDKLKADITQLKKLERVRSEFLGNVSHELRTPIFSMQGFLETLLEGAVDDPNVNRDFIRKAYEHSSRLNSLLGDLITISHIESGEMKMSFRYFALREFLDDIIGTFRPIAEHHHVSLRLEEPLSDDLTVLGDKERLRVVMENLLENAIKYNKSGGEVKISAQRSDGGVMIEVSDTGVGIATEHQPRVFERFYRVDRNRSREVGGTGLGLAIVKHIVEAHGSRIELVSAPGKGSAFRFALKR